MKKPLFTLLFTTIIINSNFIISSCQKTTKHKDPATADTLKAIQDSENKEKLEDFKKTVIFMELGFDRYKWEEVKRNNTMYNNYKGIHCYAVRYPDQENNPEHAYWYPITAWRAVSLK